MTPLTKICQDRLTVMFPESQHREVTELLEKRCGANLPDFAAVDHASDFDQIRCAVLKLSDGDTIRLRHWVDKANEDWRSVVDAAGFGHDGEMHIRWMPRRAV